LVAEEAVVEVVGAEDAMTIMATRASRASLAGSNQGAKFCARDCGF
jgi:hypothetical protein